MNYCWLLYFAALTCSLAICFILTFLRRDHPTRIPWLGNATIKALTLNRVLSNIAFLILIILAIYYYIYGLIIELLRLLLLLIILRLRFAIGKILGTLSPELRLIVFTWKIIITESTAIKLWPRGLNRVGICVRTLIRLCFRWEISYIYIATNCSCIVKISAVFRIKLLASALFSIIFSSIPSRIELSYPEIFFWAVILRMLQPAWLLRDS